MPLYNDSFYNDNFYGGSDEILPGGLHWYRSSVDGIYVFYWELVPGLLGLSDDYDFQLYLDTSPNFDSSNLTIYTKDTAVNYQNGNIVKGFDINVSSRKDRTEQLWYWKVRVIIPDIYYGTFSETSTFNILPLYEIEMAENMINYLPDEHIYRKEIVKIPVAERYDVKKKYNIYTIFNMYSRELDRTKLETELTKTDNYLKLVRDEFIYDNFGIFYDFKKPSNLTWIDYREIIRRLVDASLLGSTIKSINIICQAFTGVLPTITLIRDRRDFIVGEIDFNTGDILVEGNSVDDVGILHPAIIWGSNELASGCTIFVNNPAGFSLNQDVVRNIILQSVPSHSKIYILF